MRVHGPIDSQWLSRPAGARVITTVIGAVIGWLPGGLTGAIGAPLTVFVLRLSEASAALVFSLMCQHCSEY